MDTIDVFLYSVCSIGAGFLLLGFLVAVALMRTARRDDLQEKG